MDNPKFVYHASPKKDIELVNPSKERFRDPLEPPAIFAALKKDIAVMFMTPRDSSWVEIGSFNKGETWFFVCSDKERYILLDKGGAIYTLPSKSFVIYPEKGMGMNEAVSYEPVKPISKEEYDSTLDAMLNYGIQVYFVDKITFDKIQSSTDYGKSIIQDLKSLNLELGIKPKPIF